MVEYVNYLVGCAVKSKAGASALGESEVGRHMTLLRKVCCVLEGEDDRA